MISAIRSELKEMSDSCYCYSFFHILRSFQNQIKDNKTFLPILPTYELLSKKMQHFANKNLILNNIAHDDKIFKSNKEQSGTFASKLLQLLIRCHNIAYY